MRLQVALAILVVDFGVNNPIERYQSQSVNARGIKLWTPNDLTDNLKVLVKSVKHEKGFRGLQFR